MVDVPLGLILVECTRLVNLLSHLLDISSLVSILALAFSNLNITLHQAAWHKSPDQNWSRSKRFFDKPLVTIPWLHLFNLGGRQGCPLGAQNWNSGGQRLLVGASQVWGLLDVIASQVRYGLDSFTKTLNLFWEAMLRLIRWEPVRDLRLLKLTILKLLYLWTESMHGPDTWPSSICLPLLRRLPVWLLLLVMVALAVIDWGFDWLYSFVNMIRQLINLSLKWRNGSVNFMQEWAPDVISENFKETYCGNWRAKENILDEGSKRFTNRIRWTLI